MAIPRMKTGLRIVTAFAFLFSVFIRGIAMPSVGICLQIGLQRSCKLDSTATTFGNDGVYSLWEIRGATIGIVTVILFCIVTVVLPLASSSWFEPHHEGSFP